MGSGWVVYGEPEDSGTPGPRTKPTSTRASGPVLLSPGLAASAERSAPCRGARPALTSPAPIAGDERRRFCSGGHNERVGWGSPGSEDLAGLKLYPSGSHSRL